MHQVQREPRTQGLGSHPADVVTGLRLLLTVLLACLAVFGAPSAALAAVLVPALLSDVVDGRLARATGTASATGARFDMETDAFLVLVLSAVVATEHGAWVLGLGLVRYLFAVLVRAVPALRSEPAPRPWCKVVAAVTATVLAVCVVDLLPYAAEQTALLVVTVLLAESFAHEAVDRWRADG